MSIAWLALAALLAPAAEARPPAGVAVSCDSERRALLLTVDDLPLVITSDTIALARAPHAAPAAPGPNGHLALSASELPLGKPVPAVHAAFANERGWLLAAGGSTPGLFRVSRQDSSAATMLYEGHVLALCATEQGALAALWRSARLELLFADTNSPAVSVLTLGDLLREALARLDVSNAARALALVDVAVRRNLPELPELLAGGVEHPSAEVRASMAPLLATAAADSVQASAGLWLLAHDEARFVRERARDAVRERCGADTSALCEALFALFIEDPEPEIAWGARDALLTRAPAVALFAAPSAYKLDAVAMLANLREREGAPAVEVALGILSADPDPDVRAAARAVRGDLD